jgi:hypothetical protein
LPLLLLAAVTASLRVQSVFVGTVQSVAPVVSSLLPTY